MVSALLLIAALHAEVPTSPQASAPAAPQQTARPQIIAPIVVPGDLVLEIAVARYEPLDRRMSHASISGSESVSTTFFTTDSCSVGAGRVNDRTVGTGGGVAGGGFMTMRDPDSVRGLQLHTAWEATGRVVDRTPYGLAVAIEWRRVTQDGRDVDNGPTGSTQVTIRAGERMTLDTISSPPAACSGGSIRLEAAVVPRAERSYGGMRGGGGGGGRGVGAGGAGTGVAGGTGGAVAGSGGGGGGAASGRGAATSGGRGGGGGAAQTGARGNIEDYYRVLSGRRLNVELWLVHVRPDRDEAVQRVNVRTAGPTNYGFPTIALGSPDGASFEVNGQIQVVPDAVVVNGQPVPDSARRVSVFIQRRIFTTADPRGTAWSTTKIIEMPAPTDVVEFELPPLEGDAYKGHRLSLRLRITQ
jgi:hypothetical protein